MTFYVCKVVALYDNFSYQHFSSFLFYHWYHCNTRGRIKFPSLMESAFFSGERNMFKSISPSSSQCIFIWSLKSIDQLIYYCKRFWYKCFRFSSGRVLMRTVRGKEKTSYYPYHPSSQEDSEEHLTPKRFSSRHVSKEDLSSSR